ncbi:MAG TPA: oligosaccharide flippase family protein [Steroidobacteraceae bacterium]
MSEDLSRGALALIVIQGLYFVLGYLVVVMLARELGPVAYGAYAVIMSVLVWAEQSPRRAVPAVAAKLIAEHPEAAGDIAPASLIINLLLHVVLFAIFWWAAPWLAEWFHIENGVWLFRLAAFDLPLYGLYTALQGVHQGHHRFYRLGFSELTYALAKVVGVALLVAFGMSIEGALIVNIISSLVGILFLIGRSVLLRRIAWRSASRRVLLLARQIAPYSILVPLVSSFDIWILGASLPATEAAATTGLYVAALNIARVPGFALSTVSQVLLPSVARAFAAANHGLVRHYVNQVMRLFLILYLPACMMLFAAPEQLMQWIYTSEYSGGASMLVILTIAHGLWAIQAIVAAVLVAVGRMRELAAIMAVTMMLGLPVMVGLIHIVEGIGAAIGTALIALANVIGGFARLRREFGSVVQLRNMVRIAIAGAAMAAVSVVSAIIGGAGAFVTVAAGLLAYATVLVILSELGSAELAVIFPRRVSGSRSAPRKPKYP